MSSCSKLEATAPALDYDLTRLDDLQRGRGQDRALTRDGEVVRTRNDDRDGPEGRVHIGSRRPREHED
jgi:hypothetical protein